MKGISVKYIQKVAGTLTAIALAVAALLGLVNLVTADRIAELNGQSTRQALAAVAPLGASFTPAEITQEASDAAAAQGGALQEIYTVSTGGCAVKVSTSGSQGTIEMIVGVDADGVITGISIVDHSETAGIGSKVMADLPNDSGEPVLGQFIGLSGAGTLTVKKNVTPITGATVSTKGVTKGANAALAVAATLGAEGGAAE
ncbi:MAG: FMN-binding protein [Oscillospiraceae bacterium]|nr:FMN-binding protein [Oscillospiraceae bacterium]